MKRVLFIAIGYLFSLCINGQENLIEFNAGFEDADVGWTDIVDDWLYKRWGDNTMNAARNSDAARSGSFGIGVSIPATAGPEVAGMAGIRREVTNIMVDTDYRFSFFIRSENTGDQQVVVSIGDYQVNPIVPIVSETITYQGGEWTEVELLFSTNVPDATFEQIRFDIDFKSKVGNYAIDDVSLIESVIKDEQSISFPEIGTKEVGDPDVNLTASASSGLPVSYTSSNTEVATISGSTLSIHADGTSIITASQSGNIDFIAAPDVTQVLLVTDPNKSIQTIDFPLITDKTFNDAPFDPGAIASSGLTVSYTALTENISIENGLVAILSAGVAELAASQSGNDAFNAATTVTQSFIINKATQIIEIDPISIKGENARPFVVTASTTSGLPLTYEVSGPATISDNLIAINGIGEVTLTVAQQGNENYEASSASTTFQVVSCDTEGVVCTSGVFYVSKQGDDNNPGTADAPFLTIQKAADEMLSGEECIIMEGVYRERITPASDHVTFRAAEGEEVVVSAFEDMDQWTLHEGTIYKTDIPVNLSDQNMVMMDGQIMNLARWPNKTDFNPFNLEAIKVTGTNDQISEPSIPDEGFDEGGVVWFLGKNRWTSWRVRATANIPGVVGFSTLPEDWFFAGAHSPSNGGELILYNTLDALDTNGEWYVDRGKKVLYFQAPDGGGLSGVKVQVRQRTNLLNLNERTGITIEGIRFEGGNITMNGSTSCVIRDSEVLYGNHSLSASGSGSVLSFRAGTGSIVMNNSSADNLIERCNIQWGSGTGILLFGSNNVVQNNYIGNFNYLGSYEAPIRQGGNNRIMRNAIFNGGRDLINGGGNGAEIGYNDMYASNLTNDDCGAIYMCCGQYSDTRIHHNWIHDISSRNEAFDSYKGCGVYLDNSTEDVIVDHNVMWNLEWTGVQINWAGKNLQIYNNTIWSTDEENSNSMGRWVNGFEFTNVPVYNTLSNKDEFHFTDLKNEVVTANEFNLFENFEARNFMPKSGSQAVDGGVEVAGFTDDFSGTAPDVGAYERGKEYWVPGPDWVLEGQQAPTDCNEDAGGTAFVDKCGVCVGGNTGLEPTEGECAKVDCNGDTDGKAFFDKCGRCVGGNTGQVEQIGECKPLGLDSDNGFAIYPNPSFDSLNFKGLNSAYEMRISDMSGKIQISDIVSRDQNQVDIRSLQSGVYVVSLIKAGKSTSFRIIKEN